jgi:hypothetical protein
MVVYYVTLTHLLFFDDVVIFGEGKLREWRIFKSLLKKVSLSASLNINLNKSLVLGNKLLGNLEEQLHRLCEFMYESLDTGLRCLWYFLKSNNYIVVDWLWLIKKVEDSISCWRHKWQSLGGRLVLVKSVLEIIIVYWLSLDHVMKNILNKIQKWCFSFLWYGKKLKESIPLVS